MTEISKQQAVVISEEIEKAVNQILAKHNLSTHKYKVKYGNVLGINLEATPITLNDKGVNTSTPAAFAWLSIGTDYGFENPAEVLGATFETKGKTYKFLGIHPSTRGKFAVEALDMATGKKYGFTYTALRKLPNFDETRVLSWLRSSLDLPYKENA
jgi:hypothetical protein